MSAKPQSAAAKSTPISQEENARDYLRLTRAVSMELIQRLNFQDAESLEFHARLERQEDDLKVAERATNGAPLEELERVARQRLKLESTKQALRTFENSANILAGSVLQLAKQGLSIVYGSKSSPSKGRSVSGVKVRDLVWQGRNQAMHYESTATKADWRIMFLKLDKVNRGIFSLEPPYKSCAKAIFDLLGWQNWAVYESDMQTLLLGRPDSNQ